MNTDSTRDIQNLNHQDLLSDYLKIAESRPGALVATALRTRSVTMRDILVYEGLGSKLTSPDLESLVIDRGHMPEIKNVSALADLGRLVILQNILPGDTEYGTKLLERLLELTSQEELGEENILILLQQYISSGDRTRAAALLDDFQQLEEVDYGYLRAELSNPFTIGNEATHDAWLRAFNRVFEEEGISPIALNTEQDVEPFDRLVGESGLTGQDDGPLVSVVVTAFRPQENRLKTSLASLLNQTWKNIEVILVDDASGPEYRPLFDEIAKMDTRITVIHSAQNSGTYAARNVGYRAAQGTFITGQDDDDWSHPERIQRQVDYMQSHPDEIGCRVKAITCSEKLSRVRVGYSPVVDNASSLLIRRRAFEMSGGYLETRKAADTEFFYRIQRLSNQNVGTLMECLTVIRILSDSLSRSEFSPGWRHSARRSFRSSYSYWHRSLNIGSLCLDDQREVPVKVPRRFQIKEKHRVNHEIDVVFAGDWQQYGGPQKSMLEEIKALKYAGYRVGIMNLEAARFMNKAGQTPLIDEIQQLINNGFVDEVLFDDELDIRLFVLRYPPILQFFTHDVCRSNINSMIILANQAPSERDGSDIRYLVQDCHSQAQRAFGVNPIWVPQGPQVREFLEMYLDPTVLASFDMPGIVDIDEWWHDRVWYRSTLPVIGRHSRDDKMKWPSTSRELREAYPTDGSADIRIMGSRRTPLKILGVSKPPPSWIIYDKDELPVSDFLQSLDYFVYFQRPEAVEAFGRAILEALASGIVVILPPHFEKVFGNAALYAQPEQVQRLVVGLHGNFELYKSQLAQAKLALNKKFSYEAYRELIDSILSSKQFGVRN